MAKLEDMNPEMENTSFSPSADDLALLSNQILDVARKMSSQERKAVQGQSLDVADNIRFLDHTEAQSATTPRFALQAMNGAYRNYDFNAVDSVPANPPVHGYAGIVK